MGMRQIWDGEDLPPVGCNVLMTVASQKQPVEVTVTGYNVRQAGRDAKPYYFLVNVCVKDAQGVNNVRWLNEVHPLTWRPDE